MQLNSAKRTARLPRRPFRRSLPLVMLRVARTFFASLRRSIPYLLAALLLVAIALGIRSQPAWAGPLIPTKPSASSPASSTADPTPSDEKVAPDSPRAAMADFIKLTRGGDYPKATRYLDLSSVDEADGPLLAKHLREVLDRHLWVDITKLSPNSHGNTEDGSSADREELGHVPGAAGKPEPVVIVRHVDPSGVRWVFSASTVAQVNTWYEHLENRWLLDHLPRSLLGFGPHELRWWQWLALGPLLFVGWLIGFAITRLSRIVVQRALSEHGAETMRRLRGPATLGWMIAACYALLPWLGLYEPGQAFVERGLSAALLVAFFWTLWRAVELSQHTVSSSHWAKNSVTAHSLLLLGARLGKFAVAAFAFVAVLAELGYPVTSIITGFGIGGIALALAAQKTVENLFGAFSLAVDQPFREGDLIRVDSILGTVEAIGLRSTRIRTVDRTLVSIPNGKLAEMRIETVSARDRIRFYTLLGLVHSSGPQMLEILAGIEGILRANQALNQSTISVRFSAVTDSALNVEVEAMCETTNYNRFLEVRQALLLAIVEVVERAGSALAHPVRSLELSEGAARALSSDRPT
jgi:MscS family membrane protein